MLQTLEKLRPCTYFDLLLWLLRYRSRVRVVGRSMWPILQPGDEVLIESFVPNQSVLQVGDIVTLWHPTQSDLKIIKRITQIEYSETELQRYFLQGDNAEESTDSRHFGWIKADQILGKVVCRFDGA